MQICWVGISHQKNEVGQPVKPFCNETPTGKFLGNLIARLSRQYSHAKFNYVDDVLLDEKGKLRNPTKEELDDAWVDFSKLLENTQETTFVLFSGVLRQSVSREGVWQGDA